MSENEFLLAAIEKDIYENNLLSDEIIEKYNITRGDFHEIFKKLTKERQVSFEKYDSDIVINRRLFKENKYLCGEVYKNELLVKEYEDDIKTKRNEYGDLLIKIKEIKEENGFLREKIKQRVIKEYQDRFCFEVEQHILKQKAMTPWYEMRGIKNTFEYDFQGALYAFLDKEGFIIKNGDNRAFQFFCDEVFNICFSPFLKDVVKEVVKVSSLFFIHTMEDVFEKKHSS